jgi:hypothetical protein
MYDASKGVNQRGWVNVWFGKVSRVVVVEESVTLIKSWNGAKLSIIGWLHWFLVGAHFVCPKQMYSLYSGDAGGFFAG